jgi:TPR repeat protein
MLGYAYRLGKGVGSDPVQAYKWWKLAIANGSDDSKLNKLLDQLASQMSATRVAEAELLVTQWPSELVKLDREAADKGDTSAQVRLGIAYADGNGVPQDAAQAITWYLKAATAGNVRAYRLLGFAYILGTGVAEDKIKAYKWWKLAIDRGGEGGNPPLGKLFADLSAHMTAKELDAAKRLVAQWEADSEAGFSQ